MPPRLASGVSHSGRTRGRRGGACPLHTHARTPTPPPWWFSSPVPAHLGAPRGCNSPAHPPHTPLGHQRACPLCALSLTPPWSTPRRPQLPPHEFPPARPAPADTNGKSPPVTASWQALAEGFRVPQPASSGHLLPEPRGGSLRPHPLLADLHIPSNSASQTPKHPGPAPSSSSPHLIPCQHPALL